MNGISSVTVSPRRAQAHRVVTPEATATVEAIVKENRRVAVNEIAPHVDMIMDQHTISSTITDKKIFKVFI